MISFPIELMKLLLLFVMKFSGVTAEWPKIELTFYWFDPDFEETPFDLYHIALNPNTWRGKLRFNVTEIASDCSSIVTEI